MRHLKAFLLLFILACFSQASKGAVTPLAVGIIPPIQFPPFDFTVAGVRASVIGSHKAFYGVDIGVLGNITGSEFGGLAVSGVFNLNHGSATIFPFQIAGIANIDTGTTHVLGLQLAAILNYENERRENSVSGLQVALVNLAPYTRIYGFQIGIFNQALDVYGFQIGLFNVVNALHGFQIGLLNFNHAGLFSVCPVLNFGI
jgi:hypothetical protein